MFSFSLLPPLKIQTQFITKSSQIYINTSCPKQWMKPSYFEIGRIKRHMKIHCHSPLSMGQTCFRIKVFGGEDGSVLVSWGCHNNVTTNWVA